MLVKGGPEQNGLHHAVDIFNCIFLTESVTQYMSMIYDLQIYIHVT